MRSHMLGRLSAAAVAGLGAGLLTGIAAVALLAPTPGSQTRRMFRSRAARAAGRARALIDEGRRRLHLSSAPVVTGATPLSATLGEIAQMHAGTRSGNVEAQS